MKEGEEAIVQSEKRKREEEALFAEELETAAREARSRGNKEIAAGGKRANLYIRGLVPSLREKATETATETATERATETGSETESATASETASETAYETGSETASDVSIRIVIRL